MKLMISFVWELRKNLELMNIGRRLMKLSLFANQLVFFLVAGTFAVCIDYFFYSITLDFLGLFLSKILGFYSGVFVSFLINSSYTFKKKGRKYLSSIYLSKYVIVLTISMLVNVLTNFIILKNFTSFARINFIAFIFATFFSMIFNFISLKFIVFL